MAIQDFTTGQVLTAAQMDNLQANDYNQTVSAKVASYVLVAADKGTRITMSNAGATTITVNTSLFAAGDTLFITNIGAGASTITAGTATVSTASSLVLAQYDSGRLYFTSTGVAIWEKYQGAAASALTLIKAETVFTTVANTGTTFDGVFSSAYNNYLVIFSHLYSSVDSVDLNYQMRYSGTTSTDSGINGYVMSKRLNGTDVSWGMSSATGTLITKPANNNNRFTTVVMNVNGLDSGTASKYQLNWSFSGGDNSMGVGGVEAGTLVTARAWTGFILTPASGTISGRCTVYGLAKS
jgi:hypothetical protein